MTKITVDLVVEKYIETRDLIEQKKKAYEEEVAALKAIQEKREAWFQAELNRLGVESFKTAHGTAFTTYKDSATVADRQAFFDWVIANEAWEFLENRVSKTAVKQLLEDVEDGQESPGVPPGVNYTKIKVVQVRRK